MAKNYLIYPTEFVNITQNHTMGNHKNHNEGSPKDHPFDEACECTGRSWFYCPCDEMKVVKKYTSGVNTVWLESTRPVVMPVGSAYITIMVEHMNDDDMNKLSVGQTFKRGEKVFREGKDGATGNHFHISVGTGHMNCGGWTKNSKGSWVLAVTGKCLKAVEAFYLDGQEIKNAREYKFKNKPMEETVVAKLDNTPDKYAEDAINWATKNGILKGNENGDYKLHSNVTRQDMLVFLYRAVGK